MKRIAIVCGVIAFFLLTFLKFIGMSGLEIWSQCEG